MKSNKAMHTNMHNLWMSDTWPTRWPLALTVNMTCWHTDILSPSLGLTSFLAQCTKSFAHITTYIHTVIDHSATCNFAENNILRHDMYVLRGGHNERHVIRTLSFLLHTLLSQAHTYIHTYIQDSMHIHTFPLYVRYSLTHIFT